MSIATRPSPFVATWQGLRAYLTAQPIWRGSIAILLADGSATELTITDTLWLDVENRPVGLMLNGSAIVPYSDADPPPAGTWHLRQHPQVLVFGTAPSDPTQLAFAATTVKGV